jgi:LDH2 family malate/lactate/ureidoglycolate dehydrogenase
VDVLTAALAGSEIGRSVDQRNTTPETGGQSLLMLAVDVAHFVPLETFTARVDELIRQAHATPPAEGFAEVLVPGDLERRQEEIRRREGIPMHPEDWQAIVAGLERAGLSAELAARFGPEDV